MSAAAIQKERESQNACVRLTPMNTMSRSESLDWHRHLVRACKSDNRVYAQFARSAVKGEDIVLHTAGKSYGNYCYTADVIRAIALLLEKGDVGQAYNVCNEETTRTIAEMAQMVAEEFGKGRSKVVFDIPQDAKTYGYAPDVKMHLSAEKLCKLGWKPQYGLKEMYRRMIADLHMTETED